MTETKNLGGNSDLGPLRPGSGSLGPGSFQNTMPLDMTSGDEGNGGKGNHKMMLLGVALILAALGVYIFLKKRKK